MPRRVLTLVTLLAPAALVAQAPAQDPDVYLAQLARNGANVQVTGVTNVTRRAGYDNQPSFSLDGRSLFYTSTREDQQADIYRYNLDGGGTTRITVTAPESEYSAATIPGTTDLAMIRVERDSTQRLWRMGTAEVGKPGLGTVAFPQVKPAGYFAFVDGQVAAMFVLGRPNSLQIGDLASGRVDTFAVNIGRSLHRIPGRRAISYVSKAYDEHWWLMALDIDTRHMLPVARMPNGVEDYAWLPDGRLIAGSGSKLLVCDPATAAAWREVADLAGDGIGTITRLAVSPDGRTLAFVAVPTSRSPSP